MSDLGDREHEFDEIDQPALTQDEKIVPVTTIIGHPFVKQDNLYEAVVLVPTMLRTLYQQAPSVFAADGYEAAKVTKQNEEYDVACKKMQEPGYAVDCEIQTVVQTEILKRDALILTKEAYSKDKSIGTQNVQKCDIAIEANYVDIMQLCKADEAVQNVQTSPEVEFKKKYEGGVEFDETGTAYTKTTEDDAASETGTAYTTGTQKTTDKSIGSLDSTIKDPTDSAEAARYARIASVEQRIMCDEKFLKYLLLAELLVYYNPLLSRIKLYRAEDIQYDPAMDYIAALRGEFMVNKDMTNVALQGYKQQQRQSLQMKLLYIYKSKLLENLTVTCLDFSPIDERLLVVGYQDQAQEEHYGAVAVFYPENPTHPKIYFFTRQPVSSITWLPLGKSVVAVGFTDGTVSVFDFRHLALDSQGYALSNLESTNKTGKHSSRVWDLAWCAGDISGTASNESEIQGDYDNLVSVSADGRVVERSIKRSFEYRDILTLTSVCYHPVAIRQSEDKKSTSNRMTIIRKLSAGLSLDFLPDQSTYLVSGDDAVIRKASRAYSEQTLQAYQGHLSSIYRVRVNPCAPGYFLSCSADRTTKIWSLDSAAPLVSLRSPSEEHVYAAEWCPFKSTVLLCGSKAGRAELWDLAESTVQPRLEVPRILEKQKNEEEDDAEDVQAYQQVIPVRALKFSRKAPVAAIGYENGWVCVHRVTGIENGYVLRSVDLAAFLQVEGDRISTVVYQQEGKFNE